MTTAGSGHVHAMTDREERTETVEYPYHIGENSPLVALLITLVLLAVIVLVFWFITAASMTTMNDVVGGAG